MVWDTSPGLTTSTIILRLVSSVIPVAQLWVGKLIIDQVVRAIQGRTVDPHKIWIYLAYEIALAVLSDLLARAVNLSDSLLGDKFTNHVSLRLMEHANRMDLVSFEDPVFYDKLERARRQTTARLGMLGIIAGMGQQFITLLSLLAAVVAFSPWFLLLLVIAPSSHPSSARPVSRCWPIPCCIARRPNAASWIICACWAQATRARRK
jgi:ATP-binding cassette subfamily B protein